MDNYQQNFMNSLTGGLRFGQALKAQRDQTQLNRLAGQAYSAAPEQRSALLGQIAQVSPDSAYQQEQNFASSDERRNQTMVNMAKLLTGAPEQARPGLWRQLVPALSQFGLSELPPEYNEQTRGVIDQAAQSLVQAYSGAPAGSNIQSTYVDADGNRVAIFRDGTSRVLGANNQSIRVLEPEGAVPYGVVTSGGRAGEMVNIGGGAPAQAPVQRAADGSPVRIDPAVPAWLREQILANPSGTEYHQPGPAAQPQRPPVVFDPINGGIQQPPRTPTAAEKAAEAEAARRRVALDFAPAEAAAEAEAAQKKAEAEALAKRRAELPKVVSQADAMLTAIDGLRRHPGRALITGWSGMVNPRAYAPGGPAAGAKAFLNQITGQSFLQAFESLKGGGQITEVEGQKATQSIARLDTAQSDEEFLSALNDLYSVVESARDRARAGAGQQAAPAGSGGWGIQRVK